MGKGINTQFFIIKFLPASFRYFGMRVWYLTLGLLGHPKRIGETSNARSRRLREGFFDKYCVGHGLDIGHGGDILAPNCAGWDINDGDAQYLKGLLDAQFDFVYSSHTLEHMVDPQVTIRNWWRVVKDGGYLILYVPDRDLCEKRKVLPSRWSLDHKHFFLLDHDEKPDTIGMMPLIRRSFRNFKVIYAKICSDGCTITDPEKPSNGEYSIEIVLQKTDEGS